VRRSVVFVARGLGGVNDSWQGVYGFADIYEVWYYCEKSDQANLVLSRQTILTRRYCKKRQFAE
jgi:hypothetical protein